jgi:hypothetical protein
VWTSIVLFVLSMAYFVIQGRRHPGREESALVDPGPTEQGDEPGKPDDAASLPS